MNKINYQKILDKIIKDIENQNIRPTLLVHSCCAPCSSYVLEYLNNYFNITVLYYNPNIFPETEYLKRKSEQIRFINEKFSKSNLINDKKNASVKFMDCDYDNNVYNTSVKGFGKEPEGGKRCEICFKLRLEKTAKLAKENKFDYFVTTLTISPLKNAELLNSIGEEYSKKYDIPYLLSDFKKKEGYKRSIQLSKEYNLYRQNFCGCVYSKAEAEKRLS